MKLTVSQLHKIIKEEMALVSNIPEQHTEDCVYGKDETFMCTSCGQEACWCQGASDDMPDVCTNCWVKSQKSPVVPEGKIAKLSPLQLRRIIKEEVSLAKGEKDPQRFLHGYESGHPMDDEGYMIKSRMYDIKEMAKTICELLDAGDQLPGWVQDLVASAHTDLEHVKDYLAGDEAMRSSGHSHAGVGVVQPEIMATQESRGSRGGLMNEAHARITSEEMNAWMSGDWGFVSETPIRRFATLGGRMAVPPPSGSGPEVIANFISKCFDFIGAAQEMGVDLASEESRQYIEDNLAGLYQPQELDAAFAIL